MWWNGVLRNWDLSIRHRAPWVFLSPSLSSSIIISRHFVVSRIKDSTLAVARASECIGGNANHETRNLGYVNKKGGQEK